MTIELRGYFITNLSTSLRSLMEEIEDSTGQNIHVLRSPEWSSQSRGTGMMIGIPEGAGFSQHSACHELIHIKRYALQNVPRLIATRDKVKHWYDIAQRIHGDTEHPLMAAEEEAYGFDPKAFWAEDLENRASRLRQRKSAFDIRADLFLLLQYFECVRPAFADRLIRLAETTGNSDAIGKAKEVREHLAINKTAALRKLVQRMGFDAAEFEMLYVDVANGTEKTIGLRQA